MGAVLPVAVSLAGLVLLGWLRPPPAPAASDEDIAICRTYGACSVRPSRLCPICRRGRP